jgi:hypothetical protein
MYKNARFFSLLPVRRALYAYTAASMRFNRQYKYL